MSNPQTNVSSSTSYDLDEHLGGRFQIYAALDGPTGAPLARALMRVEAELVTQDADEILPDRLVPDRSAEQRRVEAFMALVQRVGAAIAV